MYNVTLLMYEYDCLQIYHHNTFNGYDYILLFSYLSIHIYMVFDPYILLMD